MFVKSLIHSYLVFLFLVQSWISLDYKETPKMIKQTHKQISFL